MIAMDKIFVEVISLSSKLCSQGERTVYCTACSAYSVPLWSTEYIRLCIGWQNNTSASRQGKSKKIKVFNYLKRDYSPLYKLKGLVRLAARLRFAFYDSLQALK